MSEKTPKKRREESSSEKKPGVERDVIDVSSKSVLEGRAVSRKRNIGVPEEIVPEKSEQPTDRIMLPEPITIDDTKISGGSDEEIPKEKGTSEDSGEEKNTQTPVSEKKKIEKEAEFSKDERETMERLEREYLEAYGGYYQKRSVINRLTKGAMRLVSAEDYIPKDVKEKKHLYIEARAQYAKRLAERAEDRLLEKRNTPDVSKQFVTEDKDGTLLYGNIDEKEKEKMDARAERVREAYRRRVIYNEVTRPIKEKEITARTEALSSREKTHVDGIIEGWNKLPQYQKILISSALVGGVAATGGTLLFTGGAMAGFMFGGSIFARRLLLGTASAMAGGFVADKVVGKYIHKSSEEIVKELQTLKDAGRGSNFSAEEIALLDKKRGKLVGREEEEAIVRARARLIAAAIIGGSVSSFDSTMSPVTEVPSEEQGVGIETENVTKGTLEDSQHGTYEKLSIEVQKGQGAIKMFEQLQAQVEAVKESGGTLSPTALSLLEKNPEALAREYGFYQPDQEAESALIHRGDKFVIDEEGSLLFEPKKGEVQVLAQVGDHEGLLEKRSAQVGFIDTTPKQAEGEGTISPKELSEKIAIAREIAERAGVEDGAKHPFNAWTLYKDADASSVYWNLYDTEVGGGVPGSGDLYSSLHQTLQLTHESPKPGETVSEYFVRMEDVVNAERRAGFSNALSEVPAQMPPPIEGFVTNEHGVRVWSDVPHLYRNEDGYVVMHGVTPRPDNFPTEEMSQLAHEFTKKNPGVPVLFFNEKIGAITTFMDVEVEGKQMNRITIREADIGAPLPIGPDGVPNNPGLFERLFGGGPKGSVKNFTDVVL